MQRIFNFILKVLHVLSLKVKNSFYNRIVRMQLWSNGVVVGKNFMAGGMPIVHLSRGSEVIIGDNCSIRSWAKFSDTGENRPTVIRTRGNGRITIGNNTGITSTLLFSESQIAVGQYVKIGGVQESLIQTFILPMQP